MQIDNPARFFFRHALIGMGLGAAATAAVYFSNFAGIGEMLDRSEDGPLLLVMMVLFLGSTLSALQIAFALFSSKEGEE